MYSALMIAKLEWTQSNAQQNKEQFTESQYGNNNQHRINNNRATASEQTAVKATQSQNTLYWHQILA